MASNTMETQILPSNFNIVGQPVFVLKVNQISSDESMLPSMRADGVTSIKQDFFNFLFPVQGIAGRLP